jgi:hypothetical protein
MVQRRELRLIEALDDRQDRGVREADVRVAISVAPRPDPRVVGVGDVLDGVRARRDVVQQADHHSGIEVSRDEIVHLDEDRARMISGSSGDSMRSRHRAWPASDPTVSQWENTWRPLRAHRLDRGQVCCAESLLTCVRSRPVRHSVVSPDP